MVNWDSGVGGDRMTQSKGSDESVPRFGSLARWIKRTFYRGQTKRILFGLAVFTTYVVILRWLGSGFEF